VLSEGGSIVAVGIAAGVASSYALAALAAGYVANVQFPGVVPVVGAAVLLGAAAVAASLLPAARASRVDVLQALRSE
jgi:ABC-type antimicrobial peptide transport system permease subunit